VVTLGAGLTAPLTNGLMIQVKIGNTNTAASTLNFNGTGAIPILNSATQALIGKEMIATGIYIFIYSAGASSWLLCNGNTGSATWSPVLVGGAPTYTLQRGEYSVSNNRIDFTGHLQINNLGGASASQMAGLPFNALNDILRGCVTVGYCTNLAVNATWLTGYVLENTKVIQLQGTNAAAAGTSTLAVLGNNTDIYFSGFYFTS